MENNNCLLTLMKNKGTNNLRNEESTRDLHPFQYDGGLKEILMAMHKHLPEKFDDFRIPCESVFVLDGRQYDALEVQAFLHNGGNMKNIRENVKSREFNEFLLAR